MLPHFLDIQLKDGGEVVSLTRPPAADLFWADPGTVCPALNRLGREADHSPPASVELENEWSYTFTPRTFSWRSD
jgi:hypothetical protein